jgi:hypothetical protein
MRQDEEVTRATFLRHTYDIEESPEISQHDKNTVLFISLIIRHLFRHMSLFFVAAGGKEIMGWIIYFSNCL